MNLSLQLERQSVGLSGFRSSVSRRPVYGTTRWRAGSSVSWSRQCEKTLRWCDEARSVENPPPWFRSCTSLYRHTHWSSRKKGGTGACAPSPPRSLLSYLEMHQKTSFLCKKLTFFAQTLSHWRGNTPYSIPQEASTTTATPMDARLPDFSVYTRFAYSSIMHRD